jgi:hypothetical protein
LRAAPLFTIVKMWRVVPGVYCSEEVESLKHVTL